MANIKGKKPPQLLFAPSALIALQYLEQFRRMESTCYCKYLASPDTNAGSSALDRSYKYGLLADQWRDVLGDFLFRLGDAP